MPLQIEGVCLQDNVGVREPTGTIARRSIEYYCAPNVRAGFVPPNARRQEAFHNRRPLTRSCDRAGSTGKARGCRLSGQCGDKMQKR